MARLIVTLIMLAIGIAVGYCTYFKPVKKAAEMIERAPAHVCCPEGR